MFTLRQAVRVLEEDLCDAEVRLPKNLVRWNDALEAKVPVELCDALEVLEEEHGAALVRADYVHDLLIIANGRRPELRHLLLEAESFAAMTEAALNDAHRVVGHTRTASLAFLDEIEDEMFGRGTPEPAVDSESETRTM